MKKKLSVSISKKIQEISLSRDLTQLPLQIETHEIESLSLVEKEQLAQLFHLLGQESLNSPEGTERALKAFKLGIRIDPTQRQIWLSYAQASFKLAELNPSEEVFLEVHELFSQAEMLFHTQGQKLPVQALNQWGRTLYSMAKISEEAIDFKRSTEKFHEAFARGLNDPDFLLQFGTVLGELGVIMSKEDLILQATPLLEASLKAQGDNPSAWLRMACIYKILYFRTGDVGFFEKADQSFLATARLNSEQKALWLNWGQLLTAEGKTVRDESLLTSALEKVEKAYRIDPKDPSILLTLADTLLHLGALSEQIELLKEAKEKILHALVLVPDNLEALSLLGHTHIHLGQYFSDCSYIEEAIEKFKIGLSRNKNSYTLWHGLSSAHFALGEMYRNPVEYEKAAKFCAQAIRLGGESPGYWNDWGISLMKMGDISGSAEIIRAALDKFEEAIRCYHRKHHGNPDPDWVYNYGCALDFLGEFEQNPQLYERSIAVLTQLHEHYPEAPQIRYNLAISLYHLGDLIADEMALERSAEHLEFLCRRDREDDNLFNDLGIVYLTSADVCKDAYQTRKTKELFEKAEQSLLHSLACGGIEANYWLGCLYSLLENYSDAMYFLERSKNAEALPSIEDILNNEWLDGVKNTPQFRLFLADLD